MMTSAQQQARDVLNKLYSKPYPGSHAYTHAADAIAAAIAQAEQAARDEQMERDCAAVCEKCAGGNKDIVPVGENHWAHKGGAWITCYAEPIRRAYAIRALPAAAPQTETETKP